MQDITTMIKLQKEKNNKNSQIKENIELFKYSYLCERKIYFKITYKIYS